MSKFGLSGRRLRALSLITVITFGTIGRASGVLPTLQLSGVDPDQLVAVTTADDLTTGFAIEQWSAATGYVAFGLGSPSARLPARAELSVTAYGHTPSIHAAGALRRPRRLFPWPPIPQGCPYGFFCW